MLIEVHIDSLAGEPHSLKFQSKTLFECSFMPQLDLSACSNHPMPRKKVRQVGAEQPRYGAMIEQVSGSFRNSAVRADLAGGNGKNHVTKGLVTKFVCPSAIAQDSSLQSRRQVWIAKLFSRSSNHDE
jgi:hypothetical protein